VPPLMVDPIVEPLPVKTFGGAIWATAPRQRGKLIDHQPNLVCRFLHFVDRLRCRPCQITAYATFQSQFQQIN
jgi:hypothetical protein